MDSRRKRWPRHRSELGRARLAAHPAGIAAFCRGRAGTLTRSRELMFDHCRIAVRKPSSTLSGQKGTGSEVRPGRLRPNEADSKLATLYQDTLEAPIPQDMMRLLEKIGAGH